MFKKTLFAISAIALIAAAPNLAYAKSIKHLVTRASLSQFCASVGVDTETTATVTLPDGSTVTGTIHCEAADVPGSEPGDDNGGALPHGSDDTPGAHRDGQHSGQGNGGEDNSAPGGDGNSGSDDGPNHDQGDDNGHVGGDSGGDGSSGGDSGDNSGHGGDGAGD